jgi:rod shape-determining protein MreC
VKRKTVTFWLTTGVILLITLNLPAPVSRWIKASTRDLLAPLQELSTSYARRIRNAGDAIRGWGSLPERNQELQRELVHLRNQLVELEELRQENLNLREQLGFEQRSSWKLVAARVLARDISGWWQTARVRHSEPGTVQVDQAVISSEGLVGKLQAVAGRTSDVLLISDPACRVSVRVKGKQAFGILQGQGLSWNGKVLCSMQLINKDVTLAEGDEIVTSGLGGIFPGGLPVGTILRVQTDENNLHQSAEIRPLADLANLNVVFVIQREDPT